MSAPVLSLQMLRKSFGAFVVTDDVTLDVRAGEVHALIGPNGAGKTTLIHQISGMLFPDSGRVFFRGQDITQATPQRRAREGLARSFQINSVINSLSALENVALAIQACRPHALHLLQQAADDKSLSDPAREALMAVGLAQRADSLAGALSHGEKRALEIAMAMAQKPYAILFDEPMAGIGREETGSLIALIRHIKGQCAILLIEHDMEAVFSLADRISVLVAGRIIATGTPTEVKANATVQAAYLGQDE